MPVWARIGPARAPFRHHEAAQPRRPWPFLPESRHRAKRAPAGSSPHLMAVGFRCWWRGRSCDYAAMTTAGSPRDRGVSALPPSRHAFRSERGWRGWLWVLRCWPRSAPHRRSGRRCSGGADDLKVDPRMLQSPQKEPPLRQRPCSCSVAQKSRGRMAALPSKRFRRNRPPHPNYPTAC